jgi:polyisoprenyl-phosphate glycosyltransferase
MIDWPAALADCTSVADHRSSGGPFRLSLIVPIFNEEAVLDNFFQRVLPIVEENSPDYEIICVNDGSSDGSMVKLTEAHVNNPRIKIVNLSRNFGKEAALTAGLEYARGDAVIPLDVDLQDPPELIPDLVAKWQEGYDHVVAVRRDRRCDSLAKRGTAHLFYRVIGRLSDVPIPAHAGDFRLLDRKVVDALKLLPERTRFMKGMFAWVGFRQATVTYAREARVAGSSKWRYWRLWNFALDGLLSATTLPLRIWTYLGLVISFVALSYMLFIVLRTLIVGDDVPGYPSLAAMLLFFSGMNLIGLGTIGEYLGRVFIEVKQRPTFLVSRTIGFDPALDSCLPIPPAEEVARMGRVFKRSAVLSSDGRHEACRSERLQQPSCRR